MAENEALLRLALPVHLGARMLDTVAHSQHIGSRLRVGVAARKSPDTLKAALAAASAANEELDGASPALVVVVATAAPSGDLVRAIRGVLGPVGITGGVTRALLTADGALTEGALVICVARGEGATSGVAATHGKTLTDAAQAAGRLMLAGWPFRERYPRGVGLAFTAQGTGAPAGGFLTPWRELVGPKMRTLCGTMSEATVFGAANATPIASVGCLEAPYAMGLAVAGAEHTDPAMMIHDSVEATRNALKWLNGQRPRLVLALESVARYRVLGAAAAHEWAAVREYVSEHGAAESPVVGWLCDEVAAYGRGVHPVDLPGGLVLGALGDAVRERNA
jgi:hypothetical protein